MWYTVYMKTQNFCACGCGAMVGQSKYVKGHNMRVQSRPMIPVEVRFCKYVSKDGSLWNGTPCWNWTGAKTGLHYGMIRTGGKGSPMISAHIQSYIIAGRIIPDGMVLDHLCRNPSCVNPDHLEPVTSRINTLRGVSPMVLLHLSNKCKQGHVLTPENTYIINSKREGITRRCRICNRASVTASRLRKKSTS